MNLDHELQAATKLAYEAGAIAVSARQNLRVSYKPHGQGPVTNVDHMVDDFLCTNLKKLFPQDGIISEESFNGEKTNNQERTWFIDPIDGTTALVAGTPDFVIMIGLAINGVATLGVIYQPLGDILWRGIFLHPHTYAERIENGSISALKIHKQPAKTKRVIASVSHKSARQKAMLDALKPEKIIHKNSIGLKAMLILDDEADLYVAWSKNISLWDTCAPAAIINAAYGYVAGVDGQALQYDGPITHGQAIVIAQTALNDEVWKLLQHIAIQ